MPANAISQFVLVDFENVADVDLSPLAGQRVIVTLFLGRVSRLKAQLVEQISTLPFEIRLIKVGVSRKNALDFVLAHHLGEMTARYPGGRFYIVSGDKRDFEPLVTHLRENHVHVSRHDDVESLPFLPPQKVVVETRVAAPPPPKPREDRRMKVLARLKNPANDKRPTTEKALRARIKTDLGKEATDRLVDEIFEELHTDGTFTVSAKGKIAYPPGR